MKRKLAIVGVTLVALTVGGCGNEQTKDVTGVQPQKPDHIYQFVNIDKYPNIVVLCIKGVAFATTTRDQSAAAAFRVPELDAKLCS